MPSPNSNTVYLLHRPGAHLPLLPTSPYRMSVLECTSSHQVLTTHRPCSMISKRKYLQVRIKAARAAMLYGFRDRSFFVSSMTNPKIAESSKNKTTVWRLRVEASLSSKYWWIMSMAESSIGSVVANAILANITFLVTSRARESWSVPCYSTGHPRPATSVR